MDTDALRIAIRQKLQSGRLPRDGARKVWGSPSAGEKCVACDAVVAQEQLVMEATTVERGITLQFHVQCFQLWDLEKQALLAAH